MIVLSFVISMAIAIIAVIAGVGGGVIFTPIMLAFTSIDTLVIRSTGLVVAMFSGLVSTGPFMRKGLADVKIVFFGALPIIIGGLGGAFAAIVLARYLGETGDARPCHIRVIWGKDVSCSPWMEHLQPNC